MESAIVNLKAEIHRKKSSAIRITPEQFKFKQKLKQTVKDSNNLKKDAHHEHTHKELCTDEETSKLQKSRLALEKKAAMYDQLKAGTDVLENDELNQRFLVDFQAKIYKDVADAKKEREKNEKQDRENSPDVIEDDSYKAKDPSEEWVEYVDQFGRTRVCQRKDLRKEEEVAQRDAADKTMREEFHGRWGRVEDDSKQKKDIHYQDVLYDEVRSHGTGFMPFSRDETERATQQQFLKDLGAEAQKAALTKEALHRKRRKMMEERLAKVRQKKRLKMGLPVRDDVLKTPPPSDEEDQPVEDGSLTSKPSFSPPEIQEKQPVQVREWDLDKPGVGATLTPEQWIDSRRKVRDNEFAPPTIYNQAPRSSNASKWRRRPPKSNKGVSEAPVFNATTPSPQAERKSSVLGSRWGAEVSPPMSFDYYHSSGSAKKSFSLGKRTDLEAAISQGLAQLRKGQNPGKD